MAYNNNVYPVYNNHSNHLVNKQNQRPATLNSNLERQGLVPLHALNKYFPSLFANGLPPPGNTSNASQNYLQLRGGRQPSSLLYNEFSMGLNPMHITNNGSWNSTGNWSNDQNTENHALALGQQPPFGLGPESQAAQQLEYPPDSYTTSSYTDMLNSQSLPALNLPPASLTDPLQYSLESQPNVNVHDPYAFLPYQSSRDMMNQNTQSLFGYNIPPLDINNDSSALQPLYNDASCLHDYSDNPYRVVGTEAGVGIGPNMQNMHLETESNITSALSAGVPSLPPFHNPFYPIPTFPFQPTNPAEQACFEFPSNQNFSTAPSTSYYDSALPQPSLPPPSSPETATTSEEDPDPDDVPGLYTKIDGGMWECRFQQCRRITRHRRDRGRHVGRHASWEEKQINAGRLDPKDAVAIPRLELIVYECDKPDCGYLLETGTPYFVRNYRVDRHKAVHLAKYHSGRKWASGRDGEDKVRIKKKRTGGRVAKSKNQRKTE